jgi:pimeloyl-ACP methyl ester carboxylesterase
MVLLLGGVFAGYSAGVVVLMVGTPQVKGRIVAPRKSSRDKDDADSGVELLSGVVGVVEGVHRALASGVHEVISSGVYDTVRAGIAFGGVVARLAGVSSRVAPVVESGVVQRFVGVANGAFGEYADSRGGVVPAAMTVRLGHRRVDLDRDSLTVAYPSASGHVVVLLHGLVETERSWFHRSEPDKARTGTDFGSRLVADLSCSPVYVRYNTGRHICDNGRELVELLSELVEEWPVPVTEIVLIGHSMGGLVARSAVHQAGGMAWLSKVTRLVCLGSPHTGAPLERGVVRAATLFGRFAVLAPAVRLLALRSDGIKDLARGSLHRDGQSVDTVLPAGVRQYFVVATLSRAEGSLWGRLVGDLLVAPSSAGDASQAADVEWLGGLHHFDLLHHDTVYDVVLEWLRASGQPDSA